MPTVIVVHQHYGCESGCCGHAVRVDGAEKGFHFDHPHDDVTEAQKDFVRRLVTETCGEAHVADIDWDHCIVVND